MAVKEFYKQGAIMRIIIVCLLFMFKLNGANEEFINKPVEKLTEEEKQLNGKYIGEILKHTNKEDSLNVLLEILKNPKTCYIARTSLISIGEKAINPLQEIVTEQKNNITLRSEALNVLLALNYDKIISNIENDPIMDKRVTAYEASHSPDLIVFQRSYLHFKIKSMDKLEKTNFLIKLLKERKFVFLLRDEISKIGKDSIPQLQIILKDIKSPYPLRLDALFILKVIADKECINTVTDVLTDSEEKDQLRELAARILGEIGTQESISTLLKVSKEWKFKEGSSYNLKKTAEDAVSSIKTREGIK